MRPLLRPLMLLTAPEQVPEAAENPLAMVVSPVLACRSLRDELSYGRAGNTTNGGVRLLSCVCAQTC